jgi:hypothetical protein
MVTKAATKAATKAKPTPPKKLTKAEREKLKNKLKREAKAREKARMEKVKKESDRKPLQKNIKFKKKYDTDIGKENPFDRLVRAKNVGTASQAKKFRREKGAVGDTPIRVGKDSMPTMRDVNRMTEANVSKIKVKLNKLAIDGTAEQKRQAKAILNRIDKAEAAKKADIDRRIGTTQAGKKPDAAGKYLNKVTGEMVTIKGPSGISVKERFLPLDYKGAKKADFIKNPTKDQIEQIERSMATKAKLKRAGESPEKDLERLRTKAKKKRLEKVVKTTEDPKFKRLDIRKGLTEDQKKALRKKQGGMAMKKKGMAKGGMKKKGMAKGGMKKKGYAMGGMKKKGMAMGGLKKPAANQKGLQKLPTAVRNKMGYMQKGGMKKKGMARGGMKKKSYAAGGMTVTYKVGGMAKGKMYGSVDNRKKK